MSTSELQLGNWKWSRYRPGITQKVGRDIALLFHERGTRRGWVVSSTPRPHFNPEKDPVPILQEAVLAPEPVWTGTGNFVTTGIRFRTVQPLVSRYIDWATRPKNSVIIHQNYDGVFNSARQGSN